MIDVIVKIHDADRGLAVDTYCSQYPEHRWREVLRIRASELSAGYVKYSVENSIVVGIRKLKEMLGRQGLGVNNA